MGFAGQPRWSGASVVKMKCEPSPDFQNLKKKRFQDCDGSVTIRHKSMTDCDGSVTIHGNFFICDRFSVTKFETVRHKYSSIHVHLTFRHKFRHKL